MFFFIIFVTFLGVFLPKIVEKLFRYKHANRLNPELDNLRQEIKNERENVAGISAVSEFARFARAQRKLRALEQDLSQKLKDTIEPLEQQKSRIIKWSQIIIGLIISYTAITGFGNPVIMLPQEWFYPFGWVLSTPTGIAGALSTTVWLVICRTVSQNIIS